MAAGARFLVATWCSLWLLSCASGPTEVQSTIETHHRLSAADLGKRVIILPAQEEKAGTLEFAAYGKFLEDGLRREGFQVVPAGEPAELIAFFGYGIDRGRDDSTATRSRSLARRECSPATHSAQFKVTGTGALTAGRPPIHRAMASPDVGTRRLYTRAIVVHIYDISQADEPVKLYESTATSRGSSGTMGEVIDEIVASLFQDFQATGVRTTSIAMKP